MTLACAIYTRKSSEEGLEQGFNSLDAQREACEAFIQSQKALGWKPLKTGYDDGGFSGGNMQRPALRQLLEDVAARKVRIIVVYKVDRLTRSLADFAKLVELFDQHGVSFVSVTQQFNTTSSMGRLTLNVLLSFAQFEREVTGERIRDKIAASKRKGLWMGGLPPIGYRPKDRTLVIDDEQADRVREIFRLYVDLGDVSAVKRALDERGWMTPERQTRRPDSAGNRPFSRGHLYRILGNAIYTGRIVHRGATFPGEHPAIIDEALWDAAQRGLAANRQGERAQSQVCEPSTLVGLLFDDEGHRFTPSHARKGSRRYRYYVCMGSQQPVRFPAQELDEAVRAELHRWLGDEMALHQLCDGDASQLRTILTQAKQIESRFATGDRAAQTEAIRMLVQRIVVTDRDLRLIIGGEALSCGDRTMERIVPIEINRSRKAIRLISTTAPKRQVDQKVVALILRAQGWFEQLATGCATSLEAIATAEAVTGSYVARVMHLAFLAPDIVQAIAQGDQPASLTAERLMRILPLPMSWSHQRELLGF